MRDALSLTDQALAHGNGSVRLEAVLTMLGTLDHHHLHQLLEAILRQDAPATMAKITEIATLGPDFDQLHAELEALLHRVAMAQLLPASVQEQGADADALLQLAQAMSPEEVQLCYQIVLGGRKDLPWAPDGRTALEMTCLRMLAFSPRREVLHPASLTALPPSMSAPSVTGARAASASPGKLLGAEPAPASAITPAPAKPAEPVIPSAVPDTDVMAHVSTGLAMGEDGEDAGDEPVNPLFAEQEELLREAQQMGYEAPSVEPGSASDAAPVAQAVISSADEAMTVGHDEIMQAEAVAEAVAAPTPASNLQSLLGKRNLLRSRLRSDAVATTTPPRVAPVKPAVAPEPRSAAPQASPLSTPQGSAPWQPAVPSPGQQEVALGYDDLPPLDAYDDSGSDYEEYLSQGFGDGLVSAPPVAAQAVAPTPRQSVPPKARPDPDDLPPWDLEGVPAKVAQPATTAVQVPAPVAAPSDTPSATAPMMETIDWDELEAEAEPEEGEEVARLIPSSLLMNCGDPWAELIAHTGVGGRLRQLAINSVMTRNGDLVSLVLKPEQRHLVSEKACADLAGIIGPELGQAVRVEVTLGTDPTRETPLEIEHRLYLGVREQVARDLAEDPHVQFLQQRFGAVLHPESIEPLSR